MAGKSRKKTSGRTNKEIRDVSTKKTTRKVSGKRNASRKANTGKKKIKDRGGFWTENKFSSATAVQFSFSRTCGSRN